MTRTYNQEKHLKLNKILQDNYAYFEDINFINATNENLQEIFSLSIPKIEFYKCKFSNINIPNQYITASIIFRDCEFYEKVNFDASTFAQALTVTDCIFNKETSFLNADFKDDAVFSNVLFKDKVSFRGDKVKYNPNDWRGLKFIDVNFKKDTSFFGRNFGINGLLTAVLFADTFWFTQAVLGDKFEMYDIKFTGEHKKGFVKCLELLKNALKRSFFDIYAKDIEDYERDIRQKLRIKTITQNTLPIQEKTTTPEEDKEHFTTKELAKRWKMSTNTLEVWRTQRKGPKYTKIGRRVLYHINDITNYEETRKF